MPCLLVLPTIEHLHSAYAMVTGVANPWIKLSACLPLELPDRLISTFYIIAGHRLHDASGRNRKSRP